jgi:hypothetical protein
MSLGLCAGAALAGEELARQEPTVADATRDDVFDHKRLCVTIWPAKTEVAAGEKFEVKLRVVNSSQEPQSLKVFSCSWDGHWTWKNRRIGYDTWPCFKNAIVTLQLQPGEKYEQALTMKIEGKGPSKTEPLQMGFRPHEESKTYWSNEVVLSVK